MKYEFSANSAQALFRWAKILMMEKIGDYTIEHFSPKFGKTAFRIYADVTDETAEMMRRSLPRRI